MKNKGLIRMTSVLLTLCLFFTCGISTGFVSATTQSSLESQREELERKLYVTEQKLKELGKESEDTEEYIRILGEKIEFLTEQYNLSKKQAQEIESKVSALESNIATNEREIETISVEVKELEQNIATLNKEFSSVYNAYCQRIRAIYISGEQGSILSFILMSDSVSNFLTRMQMISAVSRQDGELLDEVQQQTSEIMSVKKKLDDKNQKLKTSQSTLKESKTKLKEQRITLLKNQEEMEAQQAVIEKQQQEQNKHLEQLHAKTKQYGEFRDITQAELDEIDADIEAAARKYVPTTTTTTTKKRTTTTTTTKPSTTSHGEESTTHKTETTTTTTTTTAGSSYLKLTYPCPKYTKITCGFGAYEGHTGCDFSTYGNENQKIVAAESGTVIISTDLTNPDGSYRSYGRYIVIAHDKKTSSGKSVYTLYAHNNARLVSAGQYVKKGQQIARSGSTGNSTGPHCHFEVRVGGTSQSYAQNPANYLP